MKSLIAVVKPLAIGLLAGAAVYTAGSTIDMQQDQRTEQKEYCEMVTLNIDTGGKNGWPDYRGIYLKDCTNE